MSIVAQTDDAILLDHQKFINDQIIKNNQEMVRVDPRCFDLRVPFLMDSAVNNRIRGVKKRKKISTSAHDPIISSYLETILREIVSIGKTKGHFLLGSPTEEDIFENNKAPRKFTSNLEPTVDAIRHSLQSKPSIFQKFEDFTIFHLENRQFLLPSNSAFHLANLEQSVDFLLSSKKKYDVVVLDPPWTNKYIKRRRSYNMIDNHHLLHGLDPLKVVLSPACLVFVWVTNKKSHKEFILEELFKFWNAEFIAEWFWLKVTRFGETIHSLHSSQKAPYERLLIGRVKGQSDRLGMNVDIPENLVMVSIPSGIPSHKPPLDEVINSYVGKGHFENRLELFARSALCGWMSCGNQVIMLNDKELFPSNCA